MISFKSYFEQQSVNSSEPVFVEDIGEIEAKLDESLSNNILSVSNIEKVDKKIRFACNSKTLLKDCIPPSSVEVNIKFKNRFYEKVKVDLKEDNKNGCQILLGQPFLRVSDSIVDNTGSKLLKT